jgi:CRISPR/Cas system-associated exonuclease Cas4 (RecB family)
MTARLRQQLALLKSGSIITQPFNIYLATVEEPGFVDPSDSKMLALVSKLLTRRPRGNRSGAWHPSSLHHCPRAQVFSFLGVPEKVKVNPGLQHVFNDGHWRHVRWQISLLQSGLADAVEIGTRSDAYNLVGHLDALKDDAYTIEIKGIHSMQYQYILAEPKPEHSDQVEAYFMTTGYDTGVIIYEDKSSNNWHEHVVHPDKHRRRRIVKLLDRLNTHINQQTLPQPLDDCRARKGPIYRDCPYAYLCLRSSFGSAEAAAQETTHEEALAVTIGKRPIRVRNNAVRPKPAPRTRGSRDTTHP